MNINWDIFTLVSTFETVEALYVFTFVLAVRNKSICNFVIWNVFVITYILKKSTMLKQQLQCVSHFKEESSRIFKNVFIKMLRYSHNNFK